MACSPGSKSAQLLLYQCQALPTLRPASTTAALLGYRHRRGSAAASGTFCRTEHAKRFVLCRKVRSTRRRTSGALLCRALLAIGIQELASAFAGGSIGVLGTLLTLELAQTRARERMQCPYCSGRGKLVCGQCLALGTLPNRKSPDGTVPCRLCGRSGYVPCNHCEGTGRLFQEEVERAALQTYEQEWLGREP
ncbi:hypothetical protein, conserved [Cyanidioschyzon merolae strain 10D]|uniref:Uncharacterized protein n=1 Tax=Cyanidioschyzon merolae (strain NIES-3377 / 10D) TaxID=280699 RepID=M1UXZ1_CYAM1|nr:hypothetical protein, conserved [Cyanidioschyzon merolae strain 10D]BAM83426.1 hypothetical protein, conserved [Cyanidioschyzon merolae strain 10D]|eukprot:XP_005539462.1 hypothetical protein, conserved [Cyanidioschyzon merolae strain 10D]